MNKLALRHDLEHRLIAWDESIMAFVGSHETPRLLSDGEAAILIDMLLMRCHIRRQCIVLGSKLNPIDPIESFLRNRGIEI